MREDEAFLVVVGIIALLVLALAPLYVKSLRKILASTGYPQKIFSHNPLQKKPVLPFDRARTDPVRVAATPRGTPAVAGTPPPAAAPHLAGTATAAGPAVHTVQQSSEILSSEVQASYVRIVTQAKCFQDQIQLFQTIKQTIDTATPLEGREAVKFNENAKKIDQLAGKYTILYHNLRSLMEDETGIGSPDVLYNHRLKEFETIRQITALSRQLQPLLNENEDIVAPFIGDLR